MSGLDNNLLENKIAVKKNWKKWQKIVVAALGFVLLVIIIFAWPLFQTFTHAVSAYQSGREAFRAIKNQDLENGNEKLKETEVKIQEVKKSYRFFSFLRFLPLLGGYVADIDHLLTTALYAIESGEIMIEAVLPYADVLGLKGQGSFVLGSAEERIQKVVQTMDKIIPQLDTVESKMALMKQEMEGINERAYPDIAIKGVRIRSQLAHFKNLVSQADLALSEARPLIEVLPKLLGEPEPVKYLVLFQNDKELRPTGGFITAVAVFRLEHGKIIAEKSEDIYQLDARRRGFVPAPEPIKRYLPAPGGGLAREWFMRDSNLSPDFLISMKQFEEFYENVPGKEEIQGIIAVDTDVLLEAMKILGPIEVYGSKFTTEEVEACHCPQVIYELEKYADQPVAYERGDRKNIIARLLAKIMEQALKSSPSQYWGKLFQLGIDEVNQKHLLFYLKDEKLQKSLESLNAAGRIRDFKDDYLYINEANFGGAKANMYIEESVVQEYNLEDGKMVKTLTITYRNPYEPSNCNLEAGELCLNAPLRNWFRIFVPFGSRLIDSEGSEEKVETYDELNKTVFAGFLTVRPQGKAEVKIKYQLPFETVDRLLIQKQPGTKNFDYAVRFDSKEEKFNLDSDTEVNLK